MHAYILIAQDKTSVANKVRELFPTVSQIINYKIEKITDTKGLIRQTNIAHEPTVYVIEDFDQASPEAQNAFLKRLEEPQKNLHFVLTAKKEDRVLPTIISRCQQIRIPGKTIISDNDYKIAKEFIEGTANDKLAIVSKITKREDAVEFLEKLIFALHEKDNLQVLKKADIALSRINQNGNPTLQLTSFAISI